MTPEQAKATQRYQDAEHRIAVALRTASAERIDEIAQRLEVIADEVPGASVFDGYEVNAEAAVYDHGLGMWRVGRVTRHMFDRGGNPIVFVSACGGKLRFERRVGGDDIRKVSR